MGKTGKRIKLSDRLKFHIRLADRQGLLALGGRSNRIQQWCLAWLLVEEDAKNIEDHNLKYKALMQDLTFIFDQNLYRAIYGKENAEDADFEGEDIEENELEDVMAFLNGKKTLSAKDIIRDNEGWE